MPVSVGAISTGDYAPTAAPYRVSKKTSKDQAVVSVVLRSAMPCGNDVLCGSLNVGATDLIPGSATYPGPLVFPAAESLFPQNALYPDDALYPGDPQPIGAIGFQTSSAPGVGTPGGELGAVTGRSVCNDAMPLVISTPLLVSNPPTCGIAFCGTSTLGGPWRSPSFAAERIQGADGSSQINIFAASQGLSWH